MALYRKFSEAVHEMPTKKSLRVVKCSFLQIERIFIQAIAIISEIGIEFITQSGREINY
jgi:hypothetical protein